MKLLITIICLAFSSSVFGASSPESTSSRFFTLLKNQKTTEAIALFSVKNEAQAAYVKSFVEAGSKFMARVPVQNKPLATFQDESFAIVAIEQSLPQKPGVTEIEPACLVKKSGVWLLLPKPDDWTAPINGLDSESESHFRILIEKYTKYYDSQKKNGG